MLTLDLLRGCWWSSIFLTKKCPLYIKVIIWKNKFSHFLPASPNRDFRKKKVMRAENGIQKIFRCLPQFKKVLNSTTLLPDLQNFSQNSSKTTQWKFYFKQWIGKNFLFDCPKGSQSNFSITKLIEYNPTQSNDWNSIIQINRMIMKLIKI